MKRLLIILFLSSICLGDVYTSHQLPKTDSSLDQGSATLLWRYIYGDSFTDGTALWDSSSLIGFTSITSDIFTDGTAYWESNQLYGFDEIVGTTIVAETDLIGETITGHTITDGVLSINAGSITSAVDGTFSGTLTGDTITDGTFVVSGGEISAGEIIGTFGDINIGGNTLVCWDVETGQITAHSTSDPQLLLRHTRGIDEAGFYVDSFGDLTITPTRNFIIQPTVDSTTFFQILDADGGIPVVNVDTTNERVGFRTAAPAFTLDVTGIPNAAMRLISETIGSTTLRLDTFNGVANDRNWAFRNRWSVSGSLELLVAADATSDPIISVMIWDKDGNSGIGTRTPDTKFQVVGTAGFGDDAGNETLWNVDGFQTMHGDARPRKHIVIGGASWKKGATAPTDTYENIFATISFNTGQDDEAHYTTWVPLAWDNTTDMEVHVHWQMPDDTDNGNVFWKLKYIGVKEGEDPAGAGTEITQLSAGNHPQDELIETIFTTKMLAANLAREDDLGLMLWRHGTDGTDDCGQDAELIAMHIHYTTNRLGASGLIPVTDVLLLDDGASKLLLDDGVSFVLIRI